MVCSNCGRTNDRNCVCKICGLVGCETCLDHSMPTYHVAHDNDRCAVHKSTFPPVTASGSLTLDQIVEAVQARIQSSLSPQRFKPVYRDGAVAGITFTCPGCKQEHFISFQDASVVWTWNHSLDKPTCTPSVRVSSDFYVCHFMLTNGQLNFCSDCTHDLRGQTVDVI